MKGRHYPNSNSTQDLRVLAEKLWNAIEAHGETVKAVQSQLKTGASGVGAASSESSAGGGSFSAAPPAGYDLIQRRKIASGESVIVTVDNCIVVVDYLEVDGYLELQDTKAVVL